MRWTLLAIAAVTLLGGAPAHASVIPQLLLFNANPCPGGKYFIDQKMGNDAFSGGSAHAPKKNASALPVPVVSAMVCAKNGPGQVDQDQVIAFSGPGSAIVGYGPGALHTIDASALVPPGSVTLAPGATHTYVLSGVPVPPVTVAGHPPAGPWVTLVECTSCYENTFGGDDIMLYAQSAAPSPDLAIAGSYYIAGMTTSGFPAGPTYDLYFRPSDDSDPRVSGKSYYRADQPWAILALDGTKNFVAKNIHGRRASGNDGSLQVIGDNMAPFVRNVLLGEGGKHITVMSPGGSIIGARLSDCNYGFNGGSACNELTWNSNHALGENTLAQFVSYEKRVASTANVSATLSHPNIDGTYGTFTDDNNYLYHVGPINSGGALEIVSSGFCLQCTALVTSSANVTVTGALSNTEIAGNSLVQTQQNNAAITVLASSIRSKGFVGAQILRNSGANTGITFDIEDNLACVESGQGSGFPQPIGVLTFSIPAMSGTAKNNRINVVDSGNPVTVHSLNGAGGTLVETNNQPTTKVQQYEVGGVFYSTLADFNASGPPYTDVTGTSQLSDCPIVPPLPNYAGPVT